MNLTSQQRFAERVAQRRHIGLDKHAPNYLSGPSLLLPLALEASTPATPP
jgi:hypothetical protein